MGSPTADLFCCRSPWTGTAWPTAPVQQTGGGEGGGGREEIKKAMWELHTAFSFLIHKLFFFPQCSLVCPAAWALPCPCPALVRYFGCCWPCCSHLCGFHHFCLLNIASPSRHRAQSRGTLHPGVISELLALCSKGSDLPPNKYSGGFGEGLKLPWEGREEGDPETQLACLRSWCCMRKGQLVLQGLCKALGL